MPKGRGLPAIGRRPVSPQKTVTVQNLKVFGIDEGENLIFVEGAVPGCNGTFVLVTDSVKKEHKDLPVPTSVKEPTETKSESVAE